MPVLSFEAFSRAKGKRERTRATLLDATAKLIAVRDPGDIAILDITNAAGMSNGTFYYHFSNKAEIIGETAFLIARHLGSYIYKQGADVTDPAERISIGVRRFVHFCVEHPTWAHALGRSVNYLPSVRKQVYRNMSWTVRRGIAEGHFQMEDIDLTYETLVSIAFTGARAGMEGLEVNEAASLTSEMMLRLLGVDMEEARHIARRPFAPLHVELSSLT